MFATKYDRILDGVLDNKTTIERGVGVLGLLTAVVGLIAAVKATSDASPRATDNN